MAVVSFFRFKAALFLYGFMQLRVQDLDEMAQVRLAREYRAWVLRRNKAFLEEVKGLEHYAAFSKLLGKRDAVEEAANELVRVSVESTAGRIPIGFAVGEDGKEHPVFDMTDEERDPVFSYVALLAQKQRIAVGTRCPTSDLLMFCDEGAFPEDVMRAVILHEAYCERCLNIWNSPIPDGSADKLIGGAIRGDDAHLKPADIAAYLEARKHYDVVEAPEKTAENTVLETESHLCYCMACQRKLIATVQ